MSHVVESTDLVQPSGQADSRLLLIVLWAGVACGAVAFLAGIFMGSADQVWRALLINTLFFAGLAYGSIMFAVMATITAARWARPIKRFAEATVLFIPVSWGLFLLLFFGMDSFFEWVDPAKVIAEKSWWLNLPLFLSRNILLLLVTGLVGIFYVRSSFKADMRYLYRVAPDRISGLARRIFPETDRRDNDQRRQLVLAPIFAILYAVLTCLLAFDWMMSIDQAWYSSLFGFQYSIASIYAAGAFLILVSAIARRRINLEAVLTADRHNDLSRLVFASSLIWTYFIYAQLLVIWYANLPEETPYLILRIHSEPWSGFFQFLAVTLFLIPFFGLLTQRACRSISFSSFIAGIILFGLWCEKYFLIVPTLMEHHALQGGPSGISINIWDVMITIGVAAAFVLAFLYVLRHFPNLPISGPLLHEIEQS